MISFETSRTEARLIDRIVDRAEREASERGKSIDRKTLSMDLMACHANGCQLDLEYLLDAPVEDFVHDVWGIMRHIDRKTGKLTDHFLPRSFWSPEVSMDDIE